MHNPISRRRYLSYIAASTGAMMLPRPSFAKVTISAEHAAAVRTLGSPDAQLVIAEYFSMTCGHCGSFHTQTFPKVKSELIDTGKVRFEMYPFPLDGLALRAHALCRALPESAYFTMVDILLSEQQKWIGAADPIEALRGYGRIGGVSSAKFDAIMADRAFLEAIYQIRQDAYKEFNIESTPSFVVNKTHKFNGALGYDEFLKELESFSV